MHFAYRIALVWLFFFCSAAHAGNYLRDVFRDIRWLGRGNTGVATIDDGTAMFYNPGALGITETYSFSESMLFKKTTF